MAAMAYNNFLTFPYLVGYTPASIERLLTDNGFQVCEISGDTLLPLANESTPDFAVKEEQRYKQAVTRACRVIDWSAMPWLDVVAVAKGP
jgi:hypothetical protein